LFATPLAFRRFSGFLVPPGPAKVAQCPELRPDAKPAGRGNPSRLFDLGGRIQESQFAIELLEAPLLVVEGAQWGFFEWNELRAVRVATGRMALMQLAQRLGARASLHVPVFRVKAAKRQEDIVGDEPDPVGRFRMETVG